MTVRRRAGALAGLLAVLACALPSAASAAPTVTVRIEGESATLLPGTRVTLGERALPAGCPNPASALAALDAATGGRYATGGNGVISTILGETHDFSRSDYWVFWVLRGGRYQMTTGPCDENLAEGEELVVHVDFSSAAFSPTVFPLAVEGVPATIRPGQPFTVTVVEYRPTSQYGGPGEGERHPRAGATVTAGGATATTDAEGRATLTPGERGPVTVRAVAGGTRSALSAACVTDGADGACGTTVVKAPPACITTGNDGFCGTRDRRAPAARLAGIQDKATFTRARAPRRLSGTVAADPSGVHSVKLRLTRRHGGRCTAYSSSKERFRPATCGKGSFFRIGDRADWSYLLPERLEPGRYVLDVVAIDKAFNRDVLERGRSRVVFTVR